MVSVPLSLPLLAALGAVAWLVFGWLAQAVSDRRFMSRTGSARAPGLRPSPDLLGYSLFRDSVAAMREDRFFEEWRARFGRSGNTFRVSSLIANLNATVDVDNIRHIFTHLDDWIVGPKAKPWTPMLEAGILLSDGKTWEASRAIVRPTFARTQISQLDRLEDHVATLVSQIPPDGGAVEMQALLFDMTLSSSMDFMFGRGAAHASVWGSPEAADLEARRRRQFGDVYDYCEGQAARRTRLGWLYSLMERKEHRKFVACCRVVHAYVDGLIAEEFEKQRAEREEEKRGRGAGEKAGEKKKAADGDDGPKERYNFLRELMKATDDPIQLRWELSSLLAAGRDTTAALMSHVLHMLVRRPDVAAKLRAEIDQALGGKKPDYEQLKSLKYLRCVLHETLRFWPVAPFNIRFAARDTVLPTGGGPDGTQPLFVGKGEKMFIDVEALHRRRDLWGDDADVFRPERWERPVGSNWNFMAFSGGPRACVGQQFALVEAGYTIVRLLQTFGRIESRDDRPYAPELRIITSVKPGVLVGCYRD